MSSFVEVQRMLDRTTYCDNCGAPINGEHFFGYTEVPEAVLKGHCASVEAGESAIICPPCERDGGYPWKEGA